MSGLDTRERILEHHSTLHRYPELLRSSDEGIRRWLATKAFLGGDIAIHNDVEPWAQVRGFQHRRSARRPVRTVLGGNRVRPAAGPIRL